jgi:hypothetical protein
MTKITIPHGDDTLTQILAAGNSPDPPSPPKRKPGRPHGAKDALPRKLRSQEGQEAVVGAAMVGSNVVGSLTGPVRITPEVLKQISRRWLANESASSIAESLGLSVTAIRHAIRHNILPAWKEDLVVDAVATLTRLRHTQQIAWADWRADPTSAVASRMVRWAIDREISITGQSAPKRIEIDNTEYRVAGSSKIELEQKMLKRLAVKMQEIRLLSREVQVVDVSKVPKNGE